VLRYEEQYPDSARSGTEELLLQLLLFIDRRSSSQEQVHEIKAYLESLSSTYAFKLDVVEIEKQPHLVEFFKLVATPALVKMSPSPRQTLAGSNLIQQIEKWWPQWQVQSKIVDKGDRPTQESLPKITLSDSYYGKDIRLSDEIFGLRQEQDELKAQLRFKDKILAMLAHDLRTPLTAASMAVETIELSEKNENLSPQQKNKLKKKLFRQARSQFNIMDNMIGELLQSSQNDRSKLAVKPQPLDLCALCRDIIGQFDAKFQQKSMEFTQDLPQDLPQVYADAELIRQLIGNLLDNAIKYTPEKGSISLSVLHRTNQKVQVSVCDTGRGIPPAEREKIFEGSFRLQRDLAEKGFGLGLATCHQIVSAHYGQIWVDNSPDESDGSCFRFTLLVYK